MGYPTPPFNPVTKKHLDNIHELLDDNPRQTLQGIGDQLNLTRERVRQLIKANNDFINGLELWKFEPDHYEQLDRFDLKLIMRIKPKRSDYQGKFCPECNVIPIQKKVNRCVKCYKKSNEISIVCTNCGKSVISKGKLASSRRSYSKKNRKNPNNNFCSRRCASSYSGKFFGFGTRKKRVGDDINR